MSQFYCALLKNAFKEHGLWKNWNGVNNGKIFRNMLFRTFSVFINYSPPQKCRCLRIFVCNVTSSAGIRWHCCICFHGGMPVYKNLPHVIPLFCTLLIFPNIQIHVTLHRKLCWDWRWTLGLYDSTISLSFTFTVSTITSVLFGICW